jgi:hypothetical protein
MRAKGMDKKKEKETVKLKVAFVVLSSKIVSAMGFYFTCTNLRGQ